MTITHAATGYSVRKLIRTKAIAKRLARKLITLYCWDFTEPEAARAIDKDTMEAMRLMFLEEL